MRGREGRPKAGVSEAVVSLDASSLRSSGRSRSEEEEKEVQRPVTGYSWQKRPLQLACRCEVEEAQPMVCPYIKVTAAAQLVQRELEPLFEPSFASGWRCKTRV